ncbi:MAG: helix-turn-helix domain-containing protein [Actinomycetota bacterium]|nr:helix-turn-helix domain-containing protein [Actinomycetota bacterium]
MSNTAIPRRKGTFLPPSPSDFDALLDLSKFLEHHTEPAMLLGPDGEQIPLPLEVYETLTQIVDAMKHHRAVTVAPIDQKLTTQAAADYLGISRPTLIKLIEQKKIPCEMVDGSRHRRLVLGDLIDYQSKRSAERRAALQSLVEDAEETGLYDVPAEDYQDAIHAARKEIAGERKAQ